MFYSMDERVQLTEPPNRGGGRVNFGFNILRVTLPLPQQIMNNKNCSTQIMSPPLHILHFLVAGSFKSLQILG